MAEQQIIDWGLLSLRQAMVTQWDSKIHSTDENDPSCQSFCLTGLELSLVKLSSVNEKKTNTSTYDAFVASLELHGNKRSPTRKCWDLLVLPSHLQSTQALLARSCSEDGCWANPKVSVVWRVDCWQMQTMSSKITF